MQSFITKTTKWVKKETIECSHPDVHKIWFTGAFSESGVPENIFLTLNIYFNNGRRESFSISGEVNSTDSAEKLIIQAEEYLQKLNKTNNG